MARLETDTGESQSTDNEKCLLRKVIVRCLPPSFSEEKFKETFTPLPSFDYFHFADADSSLGAFATSRAYINFTDAEDIFKFHNEYNGFELQGDNGQVYYALIEMAIYQKIPKSRSRDDVKASTIDTDPEYIKFKEIYETKDDRQTVLNHEQILEELDKKNNAVVDSTPLIEFIKEKRQKKDEDKYREDERRKKRDTIKEKIIDRKKGRDERKKVFEKKDSDKLSKKSETEDERPDSARSCSSTLDTKIERTASESSDDIKKKNSVCTANNTKKPISSSGVFLAEDRSSKSSEADKLKDKRRIRNKDRPSLEIYRPNAEGRHDSKTKSDDSPISDQVSNKKKFPDVGKESTRRGNRGGDGAYPSYRSSRYRNDEDHGYDRHYYRGSNQHELPPRLRRDDWNYNPSKQTYYDDNYYGSAMNPDECYDYDKSRNSQMGTGSRHRQKYSESKPPRYRRGDYG